MNTLFALLAGALVGALLARRRDGKPLDYAQYMVVFALIFAVVGMFLTILVTRMA
ncbi:MULTISPECIES: hypothetical protein [Halocynthiibacter]|uniref:Uncharacterized protein n=1 Tax=Halocynthiibacter halioticoli TaxID=2986804 RepID=A0AAE3IY09_9RHOB|nr:MULTISPECIES: hypothetical protein [Halocynthiibacter]MCV6824215.1 hypothetical protein [Halocynthiibacter halioticoli]MCW4057216.1 hypothetical protein [Halocynthiibacter sp. SDUM655004]